MDFFSMIGVMCRRWKVVIPVFVLGMGITLRVASGVGAEYESYGTVIFLPATTYLVDFSDGTEFVDDLNPFISNPRATRTLARTVPLVVGSTPVRRIAVEDGLSPNYEIDLDDVESILFITAKGETPAQSSDTLDFVFFELARELAARQNVTEATVEQQVAHMEILSEIRAVENTSGGLKVMGTLGVAVILVTIMAGFVAEGFSERRAVRAEADTT